MAYAIANGIRLSFHSFGRPGGEPLLLIHGLGTQLIGWPEALCHALADAGFYVVRFDNRDIGKSERTPGRHRRRPPATVLKRHLRIPLRPRYSLDDMADDAFGLMDALAIQSAHVVGASMGGMIAQAMAIRTPRRVRSLTSIMSSTGRRGLPGASLDALRRFVMPTSRLRGPWIDHQVRLKKAIGSPDHFDEGATRRYFHRVANRSMDRSGVPRQLAAVLAAPPRDDALRSIPMPATVIHGALDRLLPKAHGEATAAAIPHARFSVFEDLGHDLPVPLVPRFVEEILRTSEGAAVRLAS